MADKEEAVDGEHVTLKIRFTPEEHKKLKMAAAEMELTIAEFMRSAVLGSAQQAVLKYFQREMAPPPKRTTTPSDE